VGFPVIFIDARDLLVVLFSLPICKREA